MKLKQESRVLKEKAQRCSKAWASEHGAAAYTY